MTIKHLFPASKPTLNLDFANAKELDPRIAFTRASTGTYVDSRGILQTAATNEPRFDHDPLTGESLGLLVEESSTNLFIQSNFGSSAWEAEPWISKISTNNPAPDGSNTAVLIGNATLITGVIQEAVNRVSLGTPHTYTAYAKATQPGQKAYFGYLDYGSSYALANINLDNGAVSYNTKVGDAFITSTDVGNGWYRLRITCTPSGSTQYFWKIGNYATGDILIWGAQLEDSSFPTSYIPTAGSTATRAADVASLTNTNVYNTDSFTILNDPYGAAGGGSTLSIVGGGQTPVKRTTVYNQDLSQSQINTLVKKDDEFWRWRILGSSFALPSLQTDGQVTVDWGDGTVEVLTTGEHTFTDGGGYHDVGFRLDSGTYFRPYVGNNSSIDTKIVAVGPAPESMRLHGLNAFDGCSNLKAFDATIDATVTLKEAWRGCSSLTSFPLINTSGVTTFSRAWQSCVSLTRFPLIDTSSGVNFYEAWRNCSSLTSFPLIDTSSGVNFQSAWRDCPGLTSFPLIDTSSGTDFMRAWQTCSSLTSFPLIDTSSATTFNLAWVNCTGLTDFPANFFDSWTGTPANSCFVQTWDGCSSLTATSVENILNSIDTSGQSAPASGVDITIDYDAGTGTPSVSTAVTNLKSRGWTITLNGVAQ